MAAKAESVYFLIDGTGKSSYIGYSNDVWKRFRTHRLKLRACAKRTKAFSGCQLAVYLTGFPSRKVALSYEWHAKRRPRGLRRSCVGASDCGHRRLPWFLAPLQTSKFDYLRGSLRLFYREDLLPSEFLVRHGYDDLDLNMLGADSAHTCGGEVGDNGAKGDANSGLTGDNLAANAVTVPCNDGMCPVVPRLTS